MKNSWNILFLSFVLLLSCADENRLEEEISAIPVEVDLTRFELLFDQANEATLPGLKQQYPQFFPEQYGDSLWVSMINDTLQKELRTGVLV